MTILSLFFTREMSPEKISKHNKFGGLGLGGVDKIGSYISC